MTNTNPLIACTVHIEGVTRKKGAQHLRVCETVTVEIQDGEGGDEFAERVAEAVREALP